MSVNNSLFCDPVYKFGTDAAEEATSSRPCARGEKLGCFGLTEPMSGSDAQTMVTERREDGRRLGAQRREELDHQRPARRLHPRLRGDRPERARRSSTRPSSSSGHARASRRTRADHKLGIHAAHSCTVFFENCKVPGQRRRRQRRATASRWPWPRSTAGASASPCQAHRHRARRARDARRLREGAKELRRPHRRSTRPSSSCWPTWRRSSTPRASSPGAPPR